MRFVEVCKADYCFKSKYFHSISNSANRRQILTQFSYYRFVDNHTKSAPRSGLQNTGSVPTSPIDHSARRRPHRNHDIILSQTMRTGTRSKSRDQNPSTVEIGPPPQMCVECAHQQEHNTYSHIEHTHTHTDTDIN